MKRRSFFKRLAQAAGLIALAPQLAFKAPTVTAEIAGSKPIPFWYQTTRITEFYDKEYLLAMKALRAGARFEDFESIP